MYLRKALVAVLVLTVSRWFAAEAKYMRGRLETPQKWHFLARFCFMSQKGLFSFNISYPKSYASQKLLLYYDDEDQWPAAYKTDPEKNCTEKHAVLRPENNQVYALDTPSPCRIVGQDSGDLYVCSGSRRFVSARDRWWYIAIDNCEGDRGLRLEYEIRLTNGGVDEPFRRELSADEFHIFETDLAFLLANVLVFIVSCRMAGILRERRLLHTTYTMYMSSVGFQIAHLLFVVICYGLYMKDGIEKVGLMVCGQVCDAIASLILLLLIILLGKGYTVTRGRLRQSSVIKITLYMSIFVMAYVGMLIWQRYAVDPGQVIYLYESPPGYVLVGLKLLGLAWFVYAVFFTVKHFPEKTTFYLLFAACYTAWFLGVPLVVLLANLAIGKYLRAKVVNGVQQAIMLLAHLFFLILTRPTAANENFPYHVKTQQTDIDGQATQPDNDSVDFDMFRASAYVQQAQPADWTAGSGQVMTIEVTRKTSLDKTVITTSS